MCHITLSLEPTRTGDQRLVMTFIIWYSSLLFFFSFLFLSCNPAFRKLNFDLNYQKRWYIDDLPVILLMGSALLPYKCIIRI